MVGKDLLYQEAVLDFLEENNDIDFILLNDELPGEEIIEFMKKIKNTKIIIFTEKSRNIDKINLEKYAYKVFSNGEISIEEIKKIIKEQNYTEELEKEIEKEVKKIGMSYPELFKPEFANVALNRYKFNSMDDMFASVGFGAITPNKIVSRVLEEYRKIHKEANIEEKIEELSKEKAQISKPSTSGVIVKGI